MASCWRPAIASICPRISVWASPPPERTSPRRSIVSELSLRAGRQEWSEPDDIRKLLLRRQGTLPHAHFVQQVAQGIFAAGAALNASDVALAGTVFFDSPTSTASTIRPLSAKSCVIWSTSDGCWRRAGRLCLGGTDC